MEGNGGASLHLQLVPALFCKGTNGIEAMAMFFYRYCMYSSVNKKLTHRFPTERAI